jgi:hypothetical protein
LEAILAESVSAYGKSPWTSDEPNCELTALVSELPVSPPKTPDSPYKLNSQADSGPQPDIPNSVLCTELLLEVPPNEVMPTVVVLAIDTDPTPCDHPHHQVVPKEVFKSIIPLAKLKGLIDEVDIPDVQDSRCETCANCPTCKMSAREKVRTLQEEFEQDVIKKSVETDTVQKRVYANLPFLKDPVEFLSNKHGGNNNRYQAARIYQACTGLNEILAKGTNMLPIILLLMPFPAP